MIKRPDEDKEWIFNWSRKRAESPRQPTSIMILQKVGQLYPETKALFAVTSSSVQLWGEFKWWEEKRCSHTPVEKGMPLFMYLYFLVKCIFSELLCHQQRVLQPPYFPLDWACEITLYMLIISHCKSHPGQAMK